MDKVLYILGQLTDQDVDWMLAVGNSKRLSAGTILIQEGEPSDAVYIVVEGTVSVSSTASEGREITRLGRGELLGEISFIDAHLPMATARAIDDITVFALARDQLAAKLARDTGFAARFYRAMAVFLSGRMRKSSRAAVLVGARASGENAAVAPRDSNGVAENTILAVSRLERLMNHMVVVEGVQLSGNDLTIEDVAKVAYQNEPVCVTPLARERMERSRQVIDRLASSPLPIYGLTTGLGALKEQRISAGEVRQFQKNILMSHSVGVPPYYSTPTVRAIMVTRLNGMARGGAGVQPKVFELLVNMLNRGVHPIIPSRGSIGMSDLAPLAHMALPLIGRGEVEYRGRRLPSKVAFQQAGLETVTLEAKDGLALCSANSASIGHGALVLRDAMTFVRAMVEIDLNSTGDNPVVLPEHEVVVSNGNFHPAGLAMGFDTLGLVLGQLTSLSTSRTIKLMGPELSGLPPQLTARPGINCGLGVMQKPVTALNAENRFLASPASLDFIPVANSIEDHATNATMTVNKASVMLENVRYVLAMELMSAAQAIDLCDNAPLGPVGRATHEAIRTVVPFIADDDILSTGIAAVHRLIASGDLLSAVSQASEYHFR